MGPTNHTAPPARPAVAALVVLGAVALLGNGMKSIVTSTVLVSEGTFASFLGVPVARVALLMEAIVAGMVVALAAYPLLLRRMTPRAIGILACAAAVAAFEAFGFVAVARGVLIATLDHALGFGQVTLQADAHAFEAAQNGCGDGFLVA